MRTTKEIRGRLEAAANSSGRSLAQEVENRLEKSFNGPDYGQSALMNPTSDDISRGVRHLTKLLARDVITYIRAVEQHLRHYGEATGGRIDVSRRTRRQAKQAASLTEETKHGSG